MNASVKGLIFDYGGTIDTNGVHWGEVFRRVYARLNAPVSREAFREAYIQVERLLGRESIIKPDHTFRKTLQIKTALQFEALGLDDRQLSERIAEACYTETADTTSRASKTLDNLAQRYPMALVSNFYGNLHTVLEEFGLAGYFQRQQVIESAAVGIRKPDPEIYRTGLRALGLQAEGVAIIGDSYKNDIAPAIQLGCHSIWLKAAGWDDGDDAPHPCIIQDFDELNGIL